MISVVLVDDHAVVRSGIRLLLDGQEDIEVVGEAGNAKDALFRARALKPDVILLDVVMPGESGIEVLPRLLTESPETKVLVLSMQDDPSYVREAFAAGAHGYVLKEAADEEVVSAVREIAQGGRYVHPALGARMVAADAEERAAAEADPLSERERAGFGSHEPGNRATALHLGAHGGIAPRAHHAEAAARDARRARSVRAVTRTAGRERLLDAQADSELRRLARPVIALVGQAGCPVDQPMPGPESGRYDRIVDDVVDDPLDLRSFENEDDLSCSQVCAVPVEPELVGIERRASGDQRLGFLVRAFPQTGDDQQAVHGCLLRLGSRKADLPESLGHPS